MLKITCILKDGKVKSKNIQFNIDIKSYVETAEKILKNNPFQRNRVSKSGSIYTLLKEDVIKGCIIPPIVLASTNNSDFHEDNIKEEVLEAILSQHSDLRILDGLQRTNSLIEVYNANKEHFDSLSEPYIIRAEIYLSISDTGILYRMLTLNTGQTPMTLRHQLEILFSKYISTPIKDINIITQTDDDSVRSINDYKFSDLIEGYNSFLEKNELPIDRFDILQNVKTIELISHDQSDQMKFVSFVKSYHSIATKVQSDIPGWEYPTSVEEGLQTKANAFGKTIHKIFNKSQPITGYGAAVSELISLGSIKSLEEISSTISDLTFSENDLLILNKYLDDVRESAKKIGNGQRIFFKLFFKYLFDKDGSTFKSIQDSLQKAKNRALAEV